MAAYYHSNPDDESYRLDVGHRVPLGEAVVHGSQLDHELVSLPYPFGPELEVCHVDDLHVVFTWLVPISESERRYRQEHGTDALEQLFDRAAFDVADPR